MMKNWRQLETAATDESDKPLINRFEEEEETIVEDWDLEPEEVVSNHLMIEAEDPESGLKMALDSLKTIHRELGTKNPVAKISGDNLNRKGIFAVAERLAGKDLIVERAGELDRITISELGELMEQDNTGMIVVLIDTRPEWKECTTAIRPWQANSSILVAKAQAPPPYRDVADMKTEAERAREEELLRLQAEREAEVARKRLCGTRRRDQATGCPRCGRCQEDPGSA